MMEEDRELLSAYRRDRSEQAFAALTRRYLDLVYSAACRQVRDADLARDVTQGVFLLLARKAESLGPETILAGWLYRTTRYVSMEAIRTEKRRKLREESMASAIHQDGASEESWKQIGPQLDEAMERIPETDRHAILLRFFEDRSLREVGSALGLSEEAAKKRVNRALEKLRSALARQGVKSTGSLLGTTLIAWAVQPAPATLAASIVPAVGAAASVAGSACGAAASGTHALSAELLVKGTVQMMTYTKIQAGAAAAILVLVTGVTGYVGVDHIHAYHASKRGGDVFAEAEQRVDQALASQKQLLAEAQRENQQLREQARELYRLRDTVTQLQSQTQPRAEAPANGLLLSHAPAALRESAEQLRELQYAHFVAAGQKTLTLQPLREEERTNYIAEINFLKNVGLALRIYATDHGDEFPADLEALLATDILDANLKDQVRSGKYEYIRFSRAESKPSLPAVWWRSPDERGIRIVAMNDGSVKSIREPAEVQKPGYLALSEMGRLKGPSHPQEGSRR